MKEFAKRRSAIFVAAFAFVIAFALLSLVSTPKFAKADTTVAGTYSKKSVSDNGNVITYDLTGSSSTNLSERTSDNGLIVIPAADAFKPNTDGWSLKGGSTLYVPIPENNVGKITATFYSTSDGRFLQLYVGEYESTADKRLYTKPGEEEGVTGAQSFDFTERDLTSFEGGLYLKFKDNNTEIKLASIKLDLTEIQKEPAGAPKAAYLVTYYFSHNDKTISESGKPAWLNYESVKNGEKAKGFNDVAVTKGYVFLGWTADENCPYIPNSKTSLPSSSASGVKWEFFNFDEAITADVDLYAVVIAPDDFNKLTIKNVDGSVISETYVPVGDKVKVEETIVSIAGKPQGRGLTISDNLTGGEKVFNAYEVYGKKAEFAGFTKFDLSSVQNVESIKVDSLVMTQLNNVELDEDTTVYAVYTNEKGSVVVPITADDESSSFFARNAAWIIGVPVAAIIIAIVVAIVVKKRK